MRSSRKLALVLAAIGLAARALEAASPAPGPSPARELPAFSHARAHWSAAPWDGPAFEVVLSNSTVVPTTPNPDPPFAAFIICKSGAEMKSLPASFDQSDKNFLIRVQVDAAKNVDPNDKNLLQKLKTDPNSFSWPPQVATVTITKFDADSTIEGTYDFTSRAGTRVRGSFQAKGMGGEWMEPRGRH